MEISYIEHDGARLFDVSRELRFLATVLHKSRICLKTVDPVGLCAYIEDEIRALGIGAEVHIDLPMLEDYTVYRLRDRFFRTFTVLAVNDNGRRCAAVIGPYLTRDVDAALSFSLGEGNHLSPSERRELTKYLSTLARIEEGSPIHSMIASLSEALWGEHAYTVEVILENASEAPPVEPTIKSGAETIIKMRALERRYEFENELMRAVTYGRSDIEASLQSAFGNDVLEQRVLDPLRNVKNYLIIMNTLLRKSAEQGGVHPLYIDELSSEIAKKIEALPSYARTGELMSEMLRAYCRLVKKHALGEYSATVRKAIVMIDADLSQDLSSGAVAEALGVSLGYLSAVFKKEVGITLTEHVRRRRMEYAEYLLTATELQVQSVALNVGIVDLNYFTRQFKTHTGMTPTEFRRERAGKRT